MNVRNHRAFGLGAGGTARDPNASALFSAAKCFYECDDGSGANAVDASGNGQTLTQTNTVGTGTGVISSSRTFTRASSMKLQRTDETILRNGGGDFGIFFWVYIETQNGFQGYATKYSGGAGSEWACYDSNGVGSRPRFGVSTDGEGINAASATWGSALADDTWHSIAAWFTVADRKCHIAANGGTPVDGADVGGAVPGGAVPFALGMLGGDANYLDGRIDQFYYGAIAFTTAQIAYLHNAGAGKTWANIQTD